MIHFFNFCLVNVLALSLSVSTFAAQDQQQSATEKAEPVIRIWPIEKVGGEENRLKETITNRGKIRFEDIKDPNLTVYQAAGTKPTPAVIYCPGGGYHHLTPIPAIVEWLNRSGVTVFMLKYTVPKDREAAFCDVQRAVRIARAESKKWNVDADQVGVLGTSAGGHLAIRLSHHHSAAAYEAIDELDRLSCEPNFVITQSAAYLATENGGSELAAEFDFADQVAPTFMAYAKDDKKFINGGVAYSEALQAKEIRSKLLLFEVGGHGMKDCDWYPQCQQWLKRLGIGVAPVVENQVVKNSLGVMSPTEIWEGYDPRKEPLAEEILKEWDADGVHYKEVYFNGEQFDGKFVRLYGIYAAPAGAKDLPAILHVHGGGQTVNKDWLKHLAARGYAALTINWGGEWPKRDRYAIWNDVPNGDHKKRKGSRITQPTPRADAYFLWTQAAMRAITYLETQPEVDVDKIGAFGISMGGTMMWNLAFDDRIKAGVAIYGCGWNTYTYNEPRYAVNHPPHEPSENDRRWRASLSPEASAPFVKFPMLFMSSTNDRHGYMDRAEQTLASIPAGVPRAWSLTPRFRHHIGSEFVEVLPTWMDVHLKGEGYWPADPKSEIVKGDAGMPEFRVTPDRPEDVTQVEIFCGLENPYAVNRHWRNATVEKQGDVYVAATPVANAAEYLFAFANITYENGVILSSPLSAVIPKKLGDVATIKEPRRVFYDGAEGIGTWTSNSLGTDPIPGAGAKRMFAATGPDDKPGFQIERISPLNYAPSDPEFRAPRGAALQFDIKSEKDQTFDVVLHKNYWTKGMQSFHGTVTVQGDAGWQTVTLTGDQFIEKKTSEPLGESINEVGVIELVSEKQPNWNDPKVMFRNFQWVGGEFVPHYHPYRSVAPPPKTKDFNSDDADHLQDHEAKKD